MPSREEVQAYCTAGTADGGWGAKVLGWSKEVLDRQFHDMIPRQEALDIGVDDFNELSMVMRTGKLGKSVPEWSPPLEQWRMVLSSEQSVQKNC